MVARTEANERTYSTPVLAVAPNTSAESVLQHPQTQIVCAPIQFHRADCVVIVCLWHDGPEWDNVGSYSRTEIRMTASDKITPSHVDYGLDAPGVIRVMLICGIVGVVVGIVAGRLAFAPALRQVAIGSILLWIGWALLVGAGLMMASSRWGKLRARDRLLDRLAFNGAETVLDVGCGHGLLLIGAAKRVPRGCAIGVDLWSQVDQKSNSAAATLANARAERVEDRVEVRDADMRALPLDDSSVDVVVSSLAIHNVTGDAERRKAIREMVRVLKPGGRVGILDIAHVGDYAKEFRAAGMSVVELHGITPWIYPPARVLTAIK